MTTDPSQYFKGRTVQEQMTEVIGYVDTRAAEVATDAIASDVAQVHQDMLDADADASAAAASAAAAAETLANAVKKTGESSQSIAGDVAIAGTLSGGVVTGTKITAPTPANNTDAANKKYVDDADAALKTYVDNRDATKIAINDINSYAVGLTGNQMGITGNKCFLGSVQVGDNEHPATGSFFAVTNGAYRRIRLQNIAEDVNTLPAQTVGYPIIAWTDVNDQNVGTILVQRMTDGKSRLVASLRNADGTQKTVILGVSD